MDAQVEECFEDSLRAPQVLPENAPKGAALSMINDACGREVVNPRNRVTGIYTKLGGNLAGAILFINNQRGGTPLAYPDRLVQGVNDQIVWNGQLNTARNDMKVQKMFNAGEPIYVFVINNRKRGTLPYTFAYLGRVSGMQYHGGTANPRRYTLTFDGDISGTWMEVIKSRVSTE